MHPVQRFSIGKIVKKIKEFNLVFDRIGNLFEKIHKNSQANLLKITQNRVIIRYNAF